jgi:hypothetical protein
MNMSKLKLSFTAAVTWEQLAPSAVFCRKQSAAVIVWLFAALFKLIF